jgi:hypothetical protein
VPCEALEVCVLSQEKLLAASFFDVGATAVSGVYAMFDPEETSRSLGIYTMLLVINYALENDKTFTIRVTLTWEILFTITKNASPDWKLLIGTEIGRSLKLSFSFQS